MNDNSLIRRARHGDAKAFVSLMARYKQALYKVGYAYFRNDLDAADALQETVLQAWAHLSDLRQSRYFKTWLTRIMINNCNAIANARQRVFPSQETLETLEIETKVETLSDLDKCEAAIAFDQLLSVLPPQYRPVFVLFYGENFTTSEVAEVMNMNENTVRSWLSRGRSIIRKDLT